jgi:hypothetical protein
MASKVQLVPLTVLLFTSSIAHAAPTAADREIARHLMDEGKSRMKDKDAQRAIDAFTRANEIMHVPTTGLALAKAHLAAGHLVEAHDLANEVVHTPRESGEPAVFDTARKSAKELDAQLKARIPTLRMKVKGGTIARVTIDDVEIPTSTVGDPVPVNPGKHVVLVKGGDGGEAKGEIELAERDAKEIELVLPQHAEAKAPAVKSLFTPSSSPAAPPSSTPQLRGFGNDDVDPGQGRRTPLATGLVYGGLGVGAVGLTVGLVTGALTLSKAADVKPQCDSQGICAPEAKDGLESANTFADIATVATVVGLAGVAVGVVGLLLPKQPADAKLSLGPSGIRGTF